MSLLCRLIENEYLGLKNGILDQSAILLSRYGCLTYMNCKVKCMKSHLHANSDCYYKISFPRFIFVTRYNLWSCVFFICTSFLIKPFSVIIWKFKYMYNFYFMNCIFYALLNLGTLPYMSSFSTRVVKWLFTSIYSWLRRLHSWLRRGWNYLINWLQYNEWTFNW